MKRWADIATGVLLVLLVVTYVGAKTHFFLRFGVPGYVSEHWPFWAVMACIAGLISLVERVGQRRDIQPK